MGIDHIAVIAEQSAAFTDAVTRPGALDLPISSCPGWTVADLVYHLGEVQAFWTLVVRAGGELPDEDQERAARDYDDDLLGW
jgi:Mycothiol maleylpyruvate isomerase N-terminal domain